MIHFQSLNAETFLSTYWQKKPLLIRNALPDFINPLSADELAGLAMEEDVESRIVLEKPSWQVKYGPFSETDFSQLPETHWTLLVQGVELLMPEVAAYMAHFDFIPPWRFDDVMISYAAKFGSVGPHYDNYDVFLYQASGERRWSLTTQHCHENNVIQDVDLRLMAQFEVEEEYILRAGDMLYLPPHVGHHGVSLSDDCMTWSFGYRSYQGLELWDSFSDYIAELGLKTPLYVDPNWATLPKQAAIPTHAYEHAKRVLQAMLSDETVLKSWFGCFATRLDRQAEQCMPLPLEDDVCESLADFSKKLVNSTFLRRDPTCRMAYYPEDEQDKKTSVLFINGVQWNTDGVTPALLAYVANHREVSIADIRPFLAQKDNQFFLYELWKLQWLTWDDTACTL